MPPTRVHLECVPWSRRCACFPTCSKRRWSAARRKAHTSTVHHPTTHQPERQRTMATGKQAFRHNLRIDWKRPEWEHFYAAMRRVVAEGETDRTEIVKRANATMERPRPIYS